MKYSHKEVSPFQRDFVYFITNDREDSTIYSGENFFDVIQLMDLFIET